MKIAAVVVTYNRKKLLIECLEALKRQTKPLNAIYIIDNASTDGTPQLLQEEGYIKDPRGGTTSIEGLHDGRLIKVVYVRMNENVGGAGGFHEGVKRAYNDGYDWLWLMDDDVEPKEDALEMLLRVGEEIKGEKSALVPARYFNGSFFNLETKRFDFKNPFRYFTYDIVTEEDLKEKYFQVSGISFEGPLIKSDAIGKIGFPDKDFFIIGDDTDYAIRLQEYGPLYMVPDAHLIKKIVTSGKPNWKTYYYIRNIIYLDRRYGENILVKYLRPFITFFKYAAYFSVKNPKIVKYILKAFRDGYSLRRGKIIRPGEF
ncbi:glycosyltransferase family 2 protein [Candidatus Bipolaricaulota bacterium]|nr:glycosyltransferase family 2 protein [Candidatus Bipolaricaulota bacterium]